MPADLWTLVLAGGEGRRLSSVTGGVPKQFWSVKGGPTLIEETARRIAPLAPDRCRTTVVDASHEPYVETLRYRRALGQVLYQPSDRGTAAGVLLGLTSILSTDPDAIVLITPADHGVLRVDDFHTGIFESAALVRAGVRDIVLLGVEPTAPTPDYGWIVPAGAGRRGPSRCIIVRGFCEKPDPAEAARLYRSGAVWNTMVLVGRARAVFAECQRHLPDSAAVFLAARQEPASGRERFLSAHYAALPKADFSRDVIARARGLLLYTWPVRMGWSDLGTPERVHAWRRAMPPARIRTTERSAGARLSGVA